MFYSSLPFQLPMLRQRISITQKPLHSSQQIAKRIKRKLLSEFYGKNELNQWQKFLDMSVIILFPVIWNSWLNVKNGIKINRFKWKSEWIAPKMPIFNATKHVICNKGFNVLQSICFVRLYVGDDDTDITQSQWCWWTLMEIQACRSLASKGNINRFMNANRHNRKSSYIDTAY